MGEQILTGSFFYIHINGCMVFVTPLLELVQLVLYIYSLFVYAI